MMFDICKLNLIRREAVFTILGEHPKQNAATSTGNGIAARAIRPDSICRFKTKKCNAHTPPFLASRPTKQPAIPRKTE